MFVITAPVRWSLRALGPFTKLAIELDQPHLAVIIDYLLFVLVAHGCRRLRGKAEGDRSFGRKSSKCRCRDMSFEEISKVFGDVTPVQVGRHS